MTAKRLKFPQICFVFGTCIHKLDRLIANSLLHVVNTRYSESELCWSIEHISHMLLFLILNWVNLTLVIMKKCLKTLRENYSLVKGSR